MENKRKTGRTSKLILKSVLELLEKGETVFIDHNTEDGNRMIDESYLMIKPTIAQVLKDLVPDKNGKEFTYKILKGNRGLEIKWVDKPSEEEMIFTWKGVKFFVKKWEWDEFKKWRESLEG